MVGMDLTWLDPDQPDARDVAGVVAVLEAARAVDNPQFPPGSVTSFLGWVRYGWDGEAPDVAVVHQLGRVTGMLATRFPRWDNTHLALVRVVVDPRVRRRGLGRQLFEAGVERARSAGRRVVCSWSVDQTAGVEFLKAIGLDPVLEEVFRRQDLLAVDWARLDREYAAAESLAAGYELVRIPGPSPEQLLPAIAAMTEAINDAPTDGLDFEDEVFTPERIREYEGAQLATGRRLYRLVARERETGVLAGHTVVGVEGEQPWRAGQHDTSVVGAHRGHRLGLLLKIGMMRWLREAEPQLRFIDTDNAASNAHMIRVNEALGYEVIAKTIEFQRHL
jgi:GNAT superfamily N-acetyltransferase/RimJ/RimL family protein N-acetyltransferase